MAPTRITLSALRFAVALFICCSSAGSARRSTATWTSSWPWWKPSGRWGLTTNWQRRQRTVSGQETPAMYHLQHCRIALWYSPITCAVEEDVNVLEFLNHKIIRIRAREQSLVSTLCLLCSDLFSLRLPSVRRHCNRVAGAEIQPADSDAVLLSGRRPSDGPPACPRRVRGGHRLRQVHR